VLGLVEVRGKEISAELRDQLLREHPQPVVSLFDVKTMAAELGFNLAGVQITLQELLDARRPAIIHLTEPDHFVLLLDGSKNSIRFWSGADGITIKPRAEVERQFDGNALVLRGGTAENTPSLRFEDLDYDVGMIPVVQKIEHVFRFTNAGGKDVTIKSLGSSCSCTTAFMDGAADGKEITLKPGDSSGIHVSFSVGYRGPVFHVVTATTSDPEYPIVYLTVHGFVPQDLQVIPSSILMVGEKGEEAARQIKVIGPQTMEITAVTAENPFLKVVPELIETGETRKVWSIQIGRSKDAPVGARDSLLTLRTTYTNIPVVNVQITSVVQGDLEVNPSSAFFGFVKRGQTKLLNLAVRSRRGHAFSIRSAKVIPPYESGTIQIKGVSKDRLRQHDLEILLHTDQPGFINRQLEIETDAFGEEALTIPVAALIEGDK